MVYERVGGLLIHKALKKAVEEDVAPGTGLSSSQVWQSLETILREFSDGSEALLRKRDAIQAEVDAWYLENKGKPYDAAAYASFLGKIGYVVPEGPAFKVQTKNVDPELACTPAPQLVVPVDNARYALNAANARWGSLMDALYGSNIISEENGAEQGKSYNPVRGAKVFEYTHKILDDTFPLAGAKYNDVKGFKLGASKQLEVELKNGKVTGLEKSDQFVGYNLTGDAVSSVLLKQNHLHMEIKIDRNSTIGATHAAGVSDVIAESAATAISDMEDSVAAVDAEDKARVYKNWTGLMKGTLEEKFNKGGKMMTRRLNPDKEFTCAKTGNKLILPGRVVLLVRNVGFHLLTDAVKFADSGRDVPEHLMDALISVLAGVHDLKKPAASPKRNSRTGSIYVVKPKMHGPEEVAFIVRVFDRVEQLLGIERNTVKLGIMDEERRTTVNLKECIREAKERIVFINTGFLDRTGDEIHTCFSAGPVQTKAAIKQATWRTAYEKWNVDIGIEVGLVGVGQIGKGMWAQPNNMKGMIDTKIAELKAGATTAWVPSPTAATLHALHYHMVDVLDIQQRIGAMGRRAKLEEILTPPLVQKQLTQGEIEHELRDSLQGILGYVARWIQLGVGCSSVPDINGIELMEDRATLRISSQLLGNWLEHGLLTREKVIETAKELAALVDSQNAGQAGYQPMGPAFADNGFKCALHMVFNAKECKNGLTEGSLTDFRRAEKVKRSTSKL